MTRYIMIPALDNRKVSIKAYVAAVKLAKANPEKTFKHGLTTWWSVTGAEIMEQFYDGMTDRINQARPYIERK